MKYINKTLDFRTGCDSVVTLGKFDGLHRGHMLLINRILETGNRENLETVVFTFDILPQSKVGHAVQRQLLTNEERSRMLRKIGIDCLVECPFVDEVMHMSPIKFIQEILVERLHAKRIVVGCDFRFGYQREGNAKMLKELGPVYGFETEIIEKATMDDREISSTWVKEALKQGDMELVSKLLGYHYTIRGEVVHGHALGRTIGVPTINQIPPKEKLLPPFGVYVSEVRITGKRYFGITNIGVKPTVLENFTGVETNLFDCEGDLYGQTAEVSLLKYLRPETKFPSMEKLKMQLNLDEQEGRDYVRKKMEKKHLLYGNRPVYNKISL
ncbi:MAG: bifunctional riboflavin kinase/FAD synthetase [Fusicatenibacter sp.]|nr:bifunctional riboflavin kinase/FAD synthetase [Lachnospiraceae bacterium]MDY2937026.1 bifunctional riboflavin kinase/FAD synthetase [Fusicatenibacter sp.]